jgi:hypothetical protein
MLTIGGPAIPIEVSSRSDSLHLLFAAAPQRPVQLVQAALHDEEDVLGRRFLVDLGKGR